MAEQSLRLGSLTVGSMATASHADVSDLTARWVAGWALSRGMAYESTAPGVWLVHVGSEVRTREYLLVRPAADEVERTLGEAGRHPGSWLTVVGEPDPAGRALLEPVERLTRHEVLMRRALPSDELALPDGLTIRESHPADGTGVVGFATITIDGETAAGGQAAIAGSDVVFDRISTVPEFRRRGLGRQLMEGLTSWSTRCGATTGILVASSDGRHLYAALGWNVAAPVATYAVPVGP